MRDRIERLPVFEGLPDDRLDELAAAAAEQLAPAGRVLLEHGHPASGFFVLEEGTVRVETVGDDVDLGPGDVFGEIPLVGLSERRTARVRAVTDVRCLSFARTDIEGVLEREPGLRDRLRRIAAGRLGADRA